MKTKEDIIHPSALESFSGILVDQQKFHSLSVPPTNVPVLEFRVSDSRAHYLGWGTGSSCWFYSLPVTVESNLNNSSSPQRARKLRWLGERGMGRCDSTAGKEINWGSGPEVAGRHSWLLRDFC